VGAVKILDETGVLVLERFGLEKGGFHHLALFDDLVRQRARVDRQFFVGGEQFAAFLFEKAFGCQPGAAFPDQTL